MLWQVALVPSRRLVDEEDVLEAVGVVVVVVVVDIVVVVVV